MSPCAPFLVALLSLSLLQSAESRFALPGSQRLIPLATDPKQTLFGFPRSRVGNAFSSDILTRLRAGNQDDDEDSDSEVKGDEKSTGTNDDDEENNEETSKPKKENDARLSMPVPVVVQAKLGRRESTILDQKVEITLQRRRSVANLKENLRKGLPGKPPVSLMQIIHEGRILDDTVLLDELVDEEDEDDEDDEDEGDDGAGEQKGTLHLTLDMIPPVDGKFNQIMPSQFPDLTTSDLLRLYASNEAALQETSLSLYGETAKKGDSDEEDEDADEKVVSSPALLTQIIPKIEERADMIESQLKDMLNPEQDGKVKAILEETRPPSAIQAVTEIRGERVRDAIPSRGVKTSLRRKVQHTFNVQSWPDTIRYICLFVFFGMFGGKTPMSRLILLLGAPSVLILQARPVKLLWKQVVYTLINDPPGILLSLLPAPQQALFHLDKEKEMEIIYGPYTTETKDLLAKKKMRTLSRPVKPDGESPETSEEKEEEEEFFDAEEEEEESVGTEESDEDEEETSGEDDEDSDDSEDE